MDTEQRSSCTDSSKCDSGNCQHLATLPILSSKSDVERSTWVEKSNAGEGWTECRPDKT